VLTAAQSDCCKLVVHHFESAAKSWNEYEAALKQHHKKPSELQLLKEKRMAAHAQGN
jgi:hypothetical protein